MQFDSENELELYHQYMEYIRRKIQYEHGVSEDSKLEFVDMKTQNKYIFMFRVEEKTKDYIVTIEDGGYDAWRKCLLRDKKLKQLGL